MFAGDRELSVVDRLTCGLRRFVCERGVNWSRVWLSVFVGYAVMYFGSCTAYAYVCQFG